MTRSQAFLLRLVAVPACVLLSGVALANAAIAPSDPAPDAALPHAGDLTMASNAGRVLVGVTLHPGTAGPTTLLVYVLPVEGEAAATTLPAAVAVNGGAFADLGWCGPTCRSAPLDLHGGETLVVWVAGEAGGSAVFQVPSLPAADGGALLDQVQRRMHALRTLHADEVFGPLQPPIRTRYAFQAPDRMSSTSDNGTELVWVGLRRYLREGPDAPWRVEELASPMQVPQFVWDHPGRPIIAPLIVGTATLDGVETRILSFFLQEGAIPLWYRLWVDDQGLVWRAEMRAQGHFMDQRYSDFDAPFTVEPPVAG